MHLVLTGATGMVGGAVLSYILSQPSTSKITRLSILTRGDIPMLTTHPSANANPNLKINVIKHSDYTTYPPELLSQIKDATGIIWALGVSQNAVSASEYVKITKEYSLEAAKALSTLPDTGQKINFVYVSGEGATWAPGYTTPIFGRVKGETEIALVSLTKKAAFSSLCVYNVRPGGVDPRKDAELYKYSMSKVPMWRKVASPVLWPLLSTAYKNMHSSTEEMAKVMVDLAMGDGEALSGVGVEADGRTLTNQGMRRLGGLSY